jgi:hypothetical protein
VYAVVRAVDHQLGEHDRVLGVDRTVRYPVLPSER